MKKLPIPAKSKISIPALVNQQLWYPFRVGLVQSFLLLCFLLPLTASANDDYVMIRTGQGHLVAKHVVKGPLNLFMHTYERAEVIDTGLRTVSAGTVREYRYFLGWDGEIIEITAGNYKKMIKRYLPNAKDLHKRLGKKGFRFENLSSMIKFYNEFRVEEQYVYVEK